MPSAAPASKRARALSYPRPRARFILRRFASSGPPSHADAMPVFSARLTKLIVRLENGSALRAAALRVTPIRHLRRAGRVKSHASLGMAARLAPQPRSSRAAIRSRAPCTVWWASGATGIPATRSAEPVVRCASVQSFARQITVAASARIYPIGSHATLRSHALSIVYKPLGALGVCAQSNVVLACSYARVNSRRRHATVEGAAESISKCGTAWSVRAKTTASWAHGLCFQSAACHAEAAPCIAHEKC